MTAELALREYFLEISLTWGPIWDGAKAGGELRSHLLRLGFRKDFYFGRPRALRLFLNSLFGVSVPNGTGAEVSRKFSAIASKYPDNCFATAQHNKMFEAMAKRARRLA